MNRRYRIKTHGVVLVIVFCLSIICSSCFSGVVGSIARKSDSIPITVTACKQGWSYSKVVLLSNQQYHALVRYVDSLQDRFDVTSDKEEFRMVCNDIVAELDTYGLLPGGMSRVQVQRLVGESVRYPWSGVLEWWENHHSSDESCQVRKNLFCAVFAVASKLSDYPEEPVILPVGVLLFLSMTPAFLASLVGQMELADRLAELGFFLWMMNPFRWFNFVWVDGYEIEVRSIGLFGLVHETLSNRGLFTGFTGLMLSPFHNRTVFLGGAFGVFDLS